MRSKKLCSLSLLFLSAACAHGQGMGMSEGAQRWKPMTNAASGVEHWDAFRFDVTQRTCALYVAVRSAAFDAPLEFGRQVEDSMVHWNKCPGGKMVACVATATAKGDTIITGIPWPY